MNLLEIGKIVRPHGVKGAVKIIGFIDDDFSKFSKVFIGKNKQIAKMKKLSSLNNDAYTVSLDIINSVEQAEKFRNQSIYINREDYKDFEDKIYLSDLINKPVIDLNGSLLGYMVDYEDYGASVILTIKTGATSYMLPYVDEIIEYDFAKQAFVIDKQKFEDMRV